LVPHYASLLTVFGILLAQKEKKKKTHKQTRGRTGTKENHFGFSLGRHGEERVGDECEERTKTELKI